MLNRILNNFNQFSQKEAFVIDNQMYTYHDFKKQVFAIFNFLYNSKINKNEIIAVVTNHDIQTYASVFAIWLAGGTFLPVNPKHPVERNRKILNKVNYKFLLSSQTELDDFYTKNERFRYTVDCGDITYEPTKVNADPDHILYLIFTSGSTGDPKGVQISLRNLQSFMDSFLLFGYNLDFTDKFLQIYDLSFDASFHCYVLPVYIGASVYPVNPSGVKYLEAIKLLQKYNLTFAKMPPSTLNFLKPYFSSIKLRALRYSLFGGEALSEYIVKEWKNCVPNAEIHNVYGPTEVTINCAYYACLHELKAYNGIVSIGKIPPNLRAVIIDENNNILPKDVKGEVCFAGNQVTPGYLNDEEKNRKSFINLIIENNEDRFYKTGDVAFYDESGIFYYCGRIDNQLQIQGYRVESGEIENAVREITNNTNNIVFQSEVEGNLVLTLILEAIDFDADAIKNSLAKKLPNYMIPQKVSGLKQFPLNANGKIDRKEIEKMITEK